VIDPTGIAATTRALFGLAKAAGDTQLYEKIVELTGMLNEAVADNSALRAQVAELSETLRVKASLRFDGRAYWTGEGTGPEDGPYCSKCWDDERKLIRLHPHSGLEDDGMFGCPKCIKNITVFPDKLKRLIEEKDRAARAGGW
jgi:hypothetical protein